MNLNLKIIPTIDKLRVHSNTSTDYIIFYSPDKIIFNEDNYAVGAQALLNTTLPDLTNTKSFKLVDESTLPALENELEDKQFLEKNKKVTSLKSILLFNSSTELVDYAGSFNHTDNAMLVYPTEEFGTELSPLASTTVWIGCYATNLEILDNGNGFSYCNHSSADIWNFAETNVELQQGFLGDNFKLKDEINLTNPLPGDLSINGIFIANGSNPAIGTNPGDLILYTGVFSDEDNKPQETITFTDGKGLVIDNLEFGVDVVVI